MTAGKSLNFSVSQFPKITVNDDSTSLSYRGAMGIHSLTYVWPCDTVVMGVRANGKVNLQYERVSVVGGLCGLSHFGFP